MAFCIRCGKQLADGEVCTCSRVQQDMNQQWIQQEMNQQSNQQAMNQQSNQQAVNQQWNQQAVNQQWNQQAVNQQYQQHFNNQASSEDPYIQSAGKSSLKGFMKRNKLFMIVPVALVIVVLAIIIISSTASSHMDPVNDFIKEINDRNTNPIDIIGVLSADFSEDAFRDLYQLIFTTDEFKEVFADTEEYLEESYDECDDEYDRWKLSFDMRSETKMDAEELEDLQDDYEYFFENCEDRVEEINEVLNDEDELEDLVDNMDIDVKEAKAILKAMRTYYTNYEDAKITQAYKVKGKFIITADKEEYKTNSVTFLVAKVKGDWVYCGVEDDFEYFEDEKSECFDYIRSILRDSYLQDFTNFGF